MKKLGLIVNPVAGMGGAVGLKGTDGPELLVRARELGAVPLAENRARSALSVLSRLGDRLDVFTFGGSMGETVAVLSGIKPRVIGAASQNPSTSADTKEAARQLGNLDVDLLLFAGGDGTARDIYDVVGTSLTVLGIPAGVKIQSAVFATSPVVAGQITESYLLGRVGRDREAEVMDINEDDYRQEILSARLYGYLKIPDCSSQLQDRKAASAPSELVAQQAIAAELIEKVADDRFLIVGPGTTCRSIMEAFGLPNSLLGVDIVRAGQLVGHDLGEREIQETIGEAPSTLFLTPVGGQGFLLGRGNQQISPEVIKRVGKENIVICATSEKLSALRGRPLLVDTGDPDCDVYLCGYYRVVTGYKEATVYRVKDCA